MAEPARLAASEASDPPLLGAGELVILLHWLSPAFPTGAFAYSHGLEGAVHGGGVTTGAALEAWIADLLTRGSSWNDLVLLAAGYGAAERRDGAALSQLNELAIALAGSRERALEMLAQGSAFLAHMDPWPSTALELLRKPAGDRVALPAAVAAAAAGQGLALEAVLCAFAHAFAANLVAAGQRLMALGQAEGVKVLAGLAPVILDAAARAACSSLDDLGAMTVRSDIAAMRHETQYSRVFRS